jgi:hypothetical protein
MSVSLGDMLFAVMQRPSANGTCGENLLGWGMIDVAERWVGDRWVGDRSIKKKVW